MITGEVDFWTRRYAQHARGWKRSEPPMADVKMLGYRNNSACMRESSRDVTQRIICSSLQTVHSAAHTIDELSFALICASAGATDTTAFTLTVPLATTPKLRGPVTGASTICMGRKGAQTGKGSGPVSTRYYSCITALFT